MHNVTCSFTFVNYDIALLTIVKLDKFINDDYLLKHTLKYKLQYNPYGDYYTCFITVNVYSPSYAYYLLGK